MIGKESKNTISEHLNYYLFMKLSFRIFLLILLSCFVQYNGIAKELTATQLGGETTKAISNRMAFSFPAVNMPKDQLRQFFFGNRLFNTNWVIAPASVESFDGLGPTFNRVSCSGCHLRDGRGKPPVGSEPMDSMLIRLSITNTEISQAPEPHPDYGTQLNDRAILGVPTEGKVEITYEIIDGEYADGTQYTLKKPYYQFTNMQFGKLDKNVLFSPRVAPHMIGLGLLEAIDQKDIMANADPWDHNRDGISGKPNWINDKQTGEKVLGRFGWKAAVPNLRQQNAGALLGDLGITTTLFPKENCPEIQIECQQSISGGEPEFSDDFLDKLTFYTQSIAVPEQRKGESKNVLKGQSLFQETGCSSCHIPDYRTGEHQNWIVKHQNISPYTDLLLHDMGKGLADNRPVFGASGREWRTPPLWGLGLIKTVNGHQKLLHDGRADGFAEAILWHGGEGRESMEKFREMSYEDRQALIDFLDSL